MLAGTFHLRYNAARFACLTPTWRLPVPGHVIGLVAAHVGAVLEAVVDGASQEVHWVTGSGPEWKRSRLNRKTPAHLAVLWFNLAHEFGRGCVMWGIPVFLFLITRLRRDDQDMGSSDPAQIRTGVG